MTANVEVGQHVDTQAQVAASGHLSDSAVKAFVKGIGDAARLNENLKMNNPNTQIVRFLDTIWYQFSEQFTNWEKPLWRRLPPTAHTAFNMPQETPSSQPLSNCHLLHGTCLDDSGLSKYNFTNCPCSRVMLSCPPIYFV